MMKKETFKKIGFAAICFVAGAAGMHVYRRFIEDHIPYSYRGNIIENVFYLAGRDTLDMLCSDNLQDFVKATTKEMDRR